MTEEHKTLYSWILHSINFTNHSQTAASGNGKKLIESFRSDNGAPNFQVVNPGSIIMMLYGLLVIPHEFWRNLLSEDDPKKKTQADECVYLDFKFDSKGTFIFHAPADGKIEKEVFMRRFRNALSHSHVSLDVSKRQFRFKNYDPSTGEINLDVSNNMEGLGQFADEVSALFLKHLKPNGIC